MTIIVSKNDLKTALSIVSKAVPNKPIHPVLGNLLLETIDHKLRLVAFDLSCGIETFVDCQVLTPLNITVPCKLLANLVNSLQEEVVTLSELENSVLLIKNGNSDLKITGMDVSEFPSLPQIEKGNQVNLDVDIFKQGISFCLVSASHEDTKGVLTGINIRYDNNSLKFASTDGYRLSTYQIDCDLSDCFDITLPAKDLKTLISFLKEDLSIFIDESVEYASFKTQSIKMTSRMLNGTFPFYEQLIPTQFENKVIVNRLSLVKSLDLVSVLFSDKNNTVKLSVDSENQLIKLIVNEKEKGKCYREVKADVKSSVSTIGFNAKYLMDGIKELNSEAIVLFFNEPQNPVVICDLEHDYPLYLVMPVQIRD